MTVSPTRQGFRDSLAQLRALAIDDPDWAPAFLRPLETLERWERAALPDLAGPRPEPARPHPTIAAAALQMAQGELSAAALMERVLDAVRAEQRTLNAFVAVAPEDDLLGEARRMDQARRDGRPCGPLHGIPISVKDVIAVEGMPNTASSRVLEHTLATRDATSVRRLREAGAIIIGKTHTHEFALGVTTPQSRNPHDPARDPGGSSGGSAISVATGMSLGSLGTDTRASIRVPAALCGVVGYKPTFGLVPTAGVTTLSWSLDHVAPMGQTVADVALMLEALAPGVPYREALAKDTRGLRVGLPLSALEGCSPEVREQFGRAASALERAGVSVVETEVPLVDDFDLAVALGLVISRCEAANYHRAFGSLEANAPRYTRAVYEQLDEAGQVSAVDYLQAQRGRALVRARVLDQMRAFDALLMPTCPVTAPLSSEVERYFLLLSQNCILWSFIGVPAVSVPCGRSPVGLPVGAQLVAGPFEDARLLALASTLEAALA
jgi:aspartyl-tRNA(Asn)/glutamyl-tRNA(Gln) amidotransferase subunit A